MSLTAFRILAFSALLAGTLAACTEKNIDDQLMTWVSGQDCLGARAESGGPYCTPRKTPSPTIAQPIYCYRSLADVDCYNQPQPSDSSSFQGKGTVGVPVMDR